MPFKKEFFLAFILKFFPFISCRWFEVDFHTLLDVLTCFFLHFRVLILFNRGGF